MACAESNLPQSLTISRMKPRMWVLFLHGGSPNDECVRSMARGPRSESKCLNIYLKYIKTLYFETINLLFGLCLRSSSGKDSVEGNNADVI